VIGVISKKTPVRVLALPLLLIAIAAVPAIVALPAGAQSSPTIGSVSFSGSQDGTTNPTVTITGTGLAPQPTASAAICGGSIFPGISLTFHTESASEAFTAGGASNLLGLDVQSYSDTQIVYKMGSGGCGYPTFGKVVQGASFTVNVNGASCTGTVDYTQAFVCSVLDKTPPVLSLPGDMTVNATSPAGAKVSFTATSSDDDGHSYPVTCSPASGATFAIGQTTVACQATDAAGNTATGGFKVTVKGAADQLSYLIGRVQNVGPGRSLAAKLQSALSSLKAGDKRGACASIDGFMSELRSQRGKSFSPGLADALLADAARIKAVIPCA
jgi:hypothetical protein